MNVETLSYKEFRKEHLQKSFQVKGDHLIALFRAVGISVTTRKVVVDDKSHQTWWPRFFSEKPKYQTITTWVYPDGGSQEWEENYDPLTLYVYWEENMESERGTITLTPTISRLPKHLEEIVLAHMGLEVKVILLPEPVVKSPIPEFLFLAGYDINNCDITSPWMFASELRRAVASYGEAVEAAITAATQEQAQV